jgi:hypothetical protein
VDDDVAMTTSSPRWPNKTVGAEYGPDTNQ